MQRVGEHLKSHALTLRGKAPDDDLFARSAFNRFYYAAFLVCREMVKNTIGKSGLRHEAFPEYLTGSFRRAISLRIKQAYSKGAITDAEREKMTYLLNVNTAGLSNMLREGFGVRVIADYKPEVQVVLMESSFELSSCTSGRANYWVREAEMYCKNLKKLWHKLGN